MRPVSDIKEPSKLLAFAKSKRLLQYSSDQTLADTTALLHRIILLSDKILPIKAYLDLLRQLQADAQRPRSFEDEFALAVGFWDLEVSKVGAVTYLKGESPDFKETKQKRVQLDTTDERVLKTLSAGLTRPNEERGAVELSMIEAAHKRLAHLIYLNDAVPEFVRRHREDEASKLEVMRELKIGPLKEKLTLTDYDIISRMARRANLISFRNRRKDPKNNYQLRSEAHKRMQEIAAKLGITPNRALNKILDDFWAIADKHEQFNTAVAKRSKKGKK